jgi:predicted nuclease with TOPRIM domain
MSEEPVMNHERFNQRLAELLDNYHAGQAQLQRLEAQRSEIQQTLLRISGAIQVLEELLDERDDADAQDAADASTRGEVEALRLAR